jgi:hypothetical protein
MRGSSRLVAVVRSVMMWGLVAGCQAPESPESPEGVETGDTRAPLVQSTASLSTARADLTVTVLPNGKVLAAGGDGSTSRLASSELYDPTTNTWSATGSMLEARAAHQAVLLKDGTVLVVGGIGSSTLASAERYNPATGTWSALPAMDEGRWEFTATRLLDGRVLVTGGCPSPSKVTARIFDPVTNTWSATGSMKQGRCDHRATLLNDGRVLITGGIHQSTGVANSVEIYDPSSGTFTEVQPAPQGHEPRTALLLEDGRVMVLGYSTNDLYDPVTNTWTQAAAPIDRRYDNVLLRLSDGSVLLAGGDPSSLERWTGGAWSIVGHLASERDTPGTALLPDGSVLFVGGYYTKWVQSGPGSWGGTPTPLATTERYRQDFTQLATFDPTLRVPRCAAPQAECDSHALLHGRGSAGAEQNQPNTLGGTCADGADWGYGVDENIRALRVRSLQGGIMKNGQQVTIHATVSSPVYGASTDVLDLFHAADANAPSWQLVASLPVPLARSGMHDLSTTFTLPAGSLQAIRGSFRRGGTAQPCTSGPYDDHDDLVFAVAPNTDPVVSFTSPTSGSIQGSTVIVNATATDDVGITRVEFFQGSTLLFTDTTAPYGFTWAAPNGPATLTARAYDGDGNSGTASVSFTVDRTAPTVALTSPAEGSTVSGTVQVAATASDNVALGRVEFYANGVLIGTRTASPYAVSWNTTGLTGTQGLTARAVDSVGNSTTTAVRTVTVTAPPPGASHDASLGTASCATVGSTCDSKSFFTGRAGLGPESNAPNTLGASCADGTSGAFHSDESLDRLVVSSADGGSLRTGGRVTVQATVWAFSSYTSDALDLYYAADARNPTWVLFATLTPTASGASTLTASYALPSGSLQAVRGQFRYGSGSGPCTLGSYNDRDDLAFAVSP